MHEGQVNPQADLNEPPHVHVKRQSGEAKVWFFSLMWENGANANPVEFIDESGIVRTDVSLG